MRNMVELSGPQQCLIQAGGRPSAGARSHQKWPAATDKRVDCAVCYALTKKRHLLLIKSDICIVDLANLDISKTAAQIHKCML